MKILDAIRMFFIDLPEQKRVVISDKMIEKYRNLCNHGLDNDESATQRILKAISLSPYVYAHKNKNVYCYFDMKIETKFENGVETMTNIWRDRRNGFYEVDRLIKKKWDWTYHIKSNEQLEQEKDETK